MYKPAFKPSGTVKYELAEPWGVWILTPPPRQGVCPSMIIHSDDVAEELPTPNGPMQTYVFRPVAAGRYPGLVLFSEIFQVTAPIRRTAALLAGHGFVVVAVPEVYHESGTGGQRAALRHGGRRPGQRAQDHEGTGQLRRRRACRPRLPESALGLHGRTCVVFGMCLGGHLAFRAAMNPEVRAGVCFYATDIHQRSLGKGMNDDTLDRMKEIWRAKCS